jgi:hypothetical protein
MVVAVQLNSAVHRHTANISLPCDRNIVHDNEMAHDKCAIEHTATSSTRQRGSRAHGKEQRHDKERSQHTAKNHRTAKADASARQRTQPRQSCLCRAHTSFFIFFISVLFFLLLMFISQLVLYFVDYLLVLLNTMCI